jgi:hypothetical protein
VFVVQKIPVIQVRTLDARPRTLRNRAQFFQASLPLAAWQPLKAFP